MNRDAYNIPSRVDCCVVALQPTSSVRSRQSCTPWKGNDSLMLKFQINLTELIFTETHYKILLTITLQRIIETSRFIA